MRKSHSHPALSTLGGSAHTSASFLHTATTTTTATTSAATPASPPLAPPLRRTNPSPVACAALPAQAAPHVDAASVAFYQGAIKARTEIAALHASRTAVTARGADATALMIVSKVPLLQAYTCASAPDIRDSVDDETLLEAAACMASPPDPPAPEKIMEKTAAPSGYNHQSRYQFWYDTCVRSARRRKKSTRSTSLELDRSGAM